MDFRTAIRTCFRKYATFSGRAQRPEFWWFTLFIILASIVLAIVDVVFFGELGAEVGVLSNIFALAVIIPSLAVGARRLHDIGKSGWWQLLSLVPLIGMIILVWWWAKPGTAADTLYGGADDPAADPDGLAVAPSERSDPQPPV